jgi:hypothetical protein
MSESKVSWGRRIVFFIFNSTVQFAYAVSCEMCQLKALEVMKEIEIQGLSWLQKLFLILLKVANKYCTKSS